MIYFIIFIVGVFVGLWLGTPPRIPRAVEIHFYHRGWRICHMVLQNGKKRTISVKFLDKSGEAAKVDGVPQWASSNPDATLLEPSEDGLSCVIHGLKAETYEVTCKADADLGEGVKEIIGTLSIEGAAGDAVTVSLSATEQEDDV